MEKHHLEKAMAAFMSEELYSSTKDKEDLIKAQIADREDLQDKNDCENKLVQDIITEGEKLKDELDPNVDTNEIKTPKDENVIVIDFITSFSPTHISPPL